MRFPAYLLGLLAPAIYAWMLRYAKNAKAKHKSGAVIFPATPMAGLCLVSFGLGCAIAIGSWAHREEKWVTAIGVVWAVLALWFWPTTIVLDGLGLTARHIWKPSRTISYSEIHYVSRMYDHKAIVYGNGKVKQIAISEFNVGDDELEAELKRRGVHYYKEFPAPSGRVP